ncbi:MAG: hypothetical protein ACOYJ5_09160 [Acutalibacteraceae bacterium]
MKKYFSHEPLSSIRQNEKGQRDDTCGIAPSARRTVDEKNKGPRTKHRPQPDKSENRCRKPEQRRTSPLPYGFPMKSKRVFKR